jgi:hypothetical protein
LTQYVYGKSIKSITNLSIALLLPMISDFGLLAELHWIAKPILIRLALSQEVKMGGY